VFVLVVVGGSEDVDLGVKLARRVSPQFDLLSCDIFDELEYARLDRGVIAGLGDIFFHVRQEGFDGGGRGDVEKQAAFLTPGGALVNINSDKNADFFKVGKVWAEGKATRRAEISTTSSKKRMSGLLEKTPANLSIGVLPRRLVKNRLFIPCRHLPQNDQIMFVFLTLYLE